MIHAHSLGRVARHYPERIALASATARLTFPQLHARVAAIAAALARDGFRAGDRLALLLRNETEYLELVHARVGSCGLSEEEDVMNHLLESVLEAHGGIQRWNQFNAVSATIVTGGGLWALKGLIQDPAPRQMSASLHEEIASVAPFGQPNWRTSFRPERVAIETMDGQVVRERMDPRQAFAGHTMNTPWDPLHRAYFNGYALWTYLTTPFFMVMPGFEVSEIEPIEEGAEQWRGLRVKFPKHIASHCDEQDFYFGDDFLLRRHDYQVDVAGSFPAAQYVDGMLSAQGLKMPTRRRAYVRGPDLRPVRDLLMVAIDLSGYVFA